MKNSRTKIRIIELIILLILMSIITILGIRIFKHTFDIGKTYHLEFHDIDSIEIGSPVRILGVDIGHVTKIKSEYNKIYVDFVVNDNKINIVDGTHATIAFSGIAGSRSIELTPPKEKVPDGTGIIIHEPIRVGDALGIVGEFTRDTMLSIGGLYEFAKDKTKDQVDTITRNFYIKTTSADDKIISVTNEITRNGESFRNRVQTTNSGMNKIYETTQLFNFPEFATYSRYGTIMAKRTFAQAKGRIMDFNEQVEICSGISNFACRRVQILNSKIENLDKLDKAFVETDIALKKLQGMLSQENIDKVYDALEKIRLQSECLENKF